MKSLMKSIDPKGAASFAVLLLALINQFLAMEGMSPLPISNDDLSGWVATGLTGAAALYGWFDSHHLTKSTDQMANALSEDAAKDAKSGGEASEDTK